jgi:hypothetical protein
MLTPVSRGVQKDVKLAEKRGKDMGKPAILLLLMEGLSQCRDHPLKGE